MLWKSFKRLALYLEAMENGVKAEFSSESLYICSIYVTKTYPATIFYKKMEQIYKNRIGLLLLYSAILTSRTMYMVRSTQSIKILQYLYELHVFKVCRQTKTAAYTSSSFLFIFFLSISLFYTPNLCKKCFL